VEIYRVIRSPDGRPAWVIEHTEPGDNEFGTYCTTEVEAEAYAKWLTAHENRQKVLVNAN
jgi:hypothetical protein